VVLGVYVSVCPSVCLCSHDGMPQCPAVTAYTWLSTEPFAGALHGARFPPFRCRSSVAVLPFCHCKIRCSVKNYVRIFRSIIGIEICNGVRKQQWEWRNGNGRTATEWWKPGISLHNKDYALYPVLSGYCYCCFVDNVSLLFFFVFCWSNQFFQDILQVKP